MMKKSCKAERNDEPLHHDWKDPLHVPLCPESHAVWCCSALMCSAQMLFSIFFYPILGRCDPQTSFHHRKDRACAKEWLKNHARTLEDCGPVDANEAGLQGFKQQRSRESSSVPFLCLLMKKKVEM